MKRMSKLKRVTEYLQSIRVYMDGVADPVMVTAMGDATRQLSSASRGIQVLFARPESSGYGSTDNINETVSAAAFVLAKAPAANTTQDVANAVMNKLLEVSETLVERIQTDITDGGCSLMLALELTGVDIVPELSIFGGWTGYSIDLQFS